MAIHKPIASVLETKIQNALINEQAQKWDSENTLSKFERAINTLDIISDGLPDDPRTASAILGVHDNLSNIHAEFKLNLLG